MTYNPNAGYPSNWVHLSYLQSALDKKLNGRNVDIEKVKDRKCRWAFVGDARHGIPGDRENYERDMGRLRVFGEQIGVVAQGETVFLAEIGLGCGGCPRLYVPHIMMRKPSGMVWRLMICALPKDICDRMANDIVGCEGGNNGCHVGLELSPSYHRMNGEPPPTPPPPTPPTPPPTKKTYMGLSSSPSAARIWLKKH